MVIVEELAPEFEVKLIAEAGDSFRDALGLHGDVFLIVKAEFVHKGSPKKQRPIL